MSHATLVATADGRICGVHSWTDGFIAVKRPRKQPTEEEILLIALRLETKGASEAAEDLLERYIAGFRI